MGHHFTFRAVGPDGTIDRGSVEAPDIGSVRTIVASRGLFVLSIEAQSTGHERRDPLSPGELALGLRILADLLDSGLPVTRALHAFQELAPPGWRGALPHIRQAVREGKSLASALATAPIDIPALVIGIARAGEAGAGIGQAVRRAAELMESRAEMRAAVRSALAYPAVVAVAGAAAVIVLITVVLPRFAKILADLGQTLPASTRVVLQLANVAHTAFLPALICVGLLVMGFRVWTRSTAGRTQWHQCLLSLPVVGSIRRGAASARVAQSLSVMLESGVPIATAMGFAAQASGDAALAGRLVDARGRISAGQSLSHALEACVAASTTTIRLVRAGEESGRLHSMLGHAAKIEQKRVDDLVRAAVRLLEPMLLLTFASVVALVAAALLQAIYSVRPTA
jgi:general secretion pathway protein F